MHKERVGLLVGRSVEKGFSTGGIEEREVDRRSEARNASKNRYKYCSGFIGLY
jgi:hypothetical protein